MARNTSVFGIYRTATDAERAVDTLLRDGFQNEAIAVLLPDARSSRDLAHVKDSKAPEGIATGVTLGGVIGCAIGVLAGWGALAMPGIGPFEAAGPLIAGLAGLGAGGTVGGLLGALIGRGIPEYEAKRYSGHAKDGGHLLSVHCDTGKQISRAKDILKLTGAGDIASAHETAGIKTDHVLDERRQAERKSLLERSSVRYPADTRRARDPVIAPTIGESADAAYPDHRPLQR